MFKYENYDYFLIAELIESYSPLGAHAIVSQQLQMSIRSKQSQSCFRHIVAVMSQTPVKIR